MTRNLLLLFVLSILALTHTRPENAAALGALTLPISGFQPGSWFDHTSPAGGNNNNMIRYDGARATDLRMRGWSGKTPQETGAAR